MSTLKILSRVGAVVLFGAATAGCYATPYPSVAVTPDRYVHLERDYEGWPSVAAQRQPEPVTLTVTPWTNYAPVTYWDSRRRATCTPRRTYRRTRRSRARPAPCRPQRRWRSPRRSRRSWRSPRRSRSYRSPRRSRSYRSPRRSRSRGRRGWHGVY